MEKEQELTPLQKRQVEKYLDLLEKWRRRFNILGFRSRRDVYLRGIKESWILAPLIPEAAFVLDVGSGAGIPAIPLKIVRPDLKMVLLEPKKKKWAFLQAVIREMGWSDVKALRQRVEDPAFQFGLKRAFDAVTTRAFVHPSSLPEIVGGYLKKGGAIYTFYSTSGDISKVPGWDLEEVEYSLEGVKGRIIVFRKEY